MRPRRKGKNNYKKIIIIIINWPRAAMDGGAPLG
jgi:hypothetical protein